MNAGAFGQTIGESIRFVEAVTHDGARVERYTRSGLRFGYRRSSLKDTGSIVVTVDIELHRDLAGAAGETYADILRKRRGKQPLDLPNCGSVFKRPPGGFAGALVEQCGLKGLRIGDAMVSPKHANFIVNLGKASASDVRMLVAKVQRRVREATGVVLEPELIFVGSFRTPLLDAPVRGRQHG
jgi:UDP-N-acetylmuramate dehydrogenase